MTRARWLLAKCLKCVLDDDGDTSLMKLFSPFAVSYFFSSLSFVQLLISISWKCHPYAEISCYHVGGVIYGICF